MPLTGNYKDIARSQIGYRSLQRISARSRIRRSTRTHENLPPDRPRIFGPRIIIGHPHPIGALDSDAAHDRSFLGVSVATTSEEHVESSSGAHVRSDTAENIVKCIWSMSVIDVDDSAILKDSSTFKTPRNWCQPFDSGDRALDGNICTYGQADSAQNILGLEDTGDRRFDLKCGTE
jgi:hypothetical protein